MSTKLAFLILAHDHYDDLEALVRRLLADESTAVIVHLDKKVNCDWPAALENKYGIDSRFRFVENRINCHWGHHTLVDATIRLIEVLNRTGIEYDYASLLSGQDWPIKNLKCLSEYLGQQLENQEYIDCHDMLTDRWIDHGYYKRRYSYYWPFRPIYLVNRLVGAANFVLGINRKLPNAWQPYSGSQWWTLTKGAVTYCVAEYNKQEVRGFFKTTFIPDEMVFQILLRNHPVYSSRITTNNLRFIKWIQNGTPKVLTGVDARTLIRGDNQFFFARKVSQTTSIDFIRTINNTLTRGC